MAGMLSLASQNLTRSISRNFCTTTEVLAASFKFREPLCSHRSTKRSRSKAHLVINPRSKSINLRQENGIYLQGIKYFHTSIVRCESQDVSCPVFPESVAEGDVRWEKKVGDQVAVDEVVLEIETDKVAIPVPSPANGIIEEAYVKDGDTVKANAKLFRLKLTEGGAAPAAAKPADAPAPAAAQPAAAAPPPSSPPPPPAAAPPPKPAAAPPQPSPPKAAMPVAAIRHAQAIEAATVKVPPADPTKEIAGTRTVHRVKMNKMRQKIAQRLKEAQNTNAMLTTMNEIDMKTIMDFRKAHQDAFLKKFGIKFGFMSVFCKAVAYALQDQPVVNAVISDDGLEVLYRDYIDISVAVATPKGLVVPVLRNVEQMNYADIELGLAALSEKARKGALAIEDMDGGTFTISNGGVFGSMFGTPIINPPQSAILGMHGIFDRPIAIKGEVKVRPMMYVALTYDHRLIDGREAVLFLRKIKSAVEDPAVILTGI
ncbi:dihydrolipoyllysine-residue succinyltransferase component of 2-oxoglutarate dehydrogenase complex, mitochondrial [Agrilus planipennis]|uniref:Dihydrolipoyllysine-residue succinyltransferase component of 2-oxoglutarate dehydrogenase complex, mitochondrial n=1 Tax=Agrilus planipennis TaxID=224129 RepID=A0A1W4WSF7_AGRPL|nr:dihydrolipoyllysine-residue succinyltransferase component of 2-oxoglutarate dehydrogenase complex, mitochondrial [Agrilus planipennis]